MKRLGNQVTWESDVGDLLLKKLKSEYQYLKTEKEYQEQIFNKAQSEFKDYFNPKLGIQEPKPQKKQTKKKPKICSIIIDLSLSQL